MCLPTKRYVLIQLHMLRRIIHFLGFNMQKISWGLRPQTTKEGYSFFLKKVYDSYQVLYFQRTFHIPVFDVYFFSRGGGADPEAKSRGVA